jgi:hypothetical protein
MPQRPGDVQREQRDQDLPGHGLVQFAKRR